MSRSRSRIPDPVFRGVEPLLQKESGLASCGANVAPSLNGVDLSLGTQLLDPTCRAKCSSILHDSLDKNNSITKTLETRINPILLLVYFG